VRILTTEPLTLELREWETATAPEGADLTDADRRLAESLADGDRRFVVEELRGGVRLRATSWIGVVRFERFEVRVVPKLAGGNLGVLEMLEYASGLDALARLRATRELDVERDGRLIDLLAQLLAGACERILHDGLLQDYVTREETLGVLRGRLRVDVQVRRRFGRVDQLECRFDELETNVLDNQLSPRRLAWHAECAATTRRGGALRGSTACSLRPPMRPRSSRRLPTRSSNTRAATSGIGLPMPSAGCSFAGSRCAICLPPVAVGRMRSCST
jgi:5-methylcytosine-specific restriction enzyme subunit McrC